MHTAEIPSGASLFEAAEIAIAKAQILRNVNFEFNGHFIQVYSTSDPRDICLIYDLKCRIHNLEKEKK